MRKTSSKMAHVIAQPDVRDPTACKTVASGIEIDWRTQPSLGRFTPAGYAHMRLASPPALRVLGLNHINISASPELIEEVKCFYINIIGLTVGPRARLDHEGYWLYAGHSPILHLSARTHLIEAGEQKGFLNHVSLSCVGLRDAIAKLQEAEIPYRAATVFDTGQTQLFVQDPAGISVELTFFNEFLTENRE